MIEHIKSSRVSVIIRLILLALVCVGGAELIVCYFMDPSLYQKMTAPVKETVSVLAQEVQQRKEMLFEKEEDSIKKQQEEQAGNETPTSGNSSYLDHTMTRIECRDGKEILVGGSTEIIYYNQCDEEWSDLPYGSDTIGKYGCGPTVMAMAVSSLTQQNINPEDMATWARKHGYWAKKSGSYLSIVEGTCEAFGISVEANREFNAEQILQELASGKVMVALMGTGQFTETGHFILICGVTLDGGVLIADSNSRDRSLQGWEIQTILDELSSNRKNGAPLWTLTPLGSELTDY